MHGDRLEPALERAAGDEVHQGEPGRTLRPSPRPLVVYTLAIFIGGALLAPWVYWLVQRVAPGSGLAANPFRRYVDRTLLGTALVGIWPFLRAVKMGSLRNVGLLRLPGQGKRLASGFALGFGSLAIAAVITLAAQVREFNTGLSLNSLAGKLAVAAGTAVAVGVLEELLFRGVIFGAMRRVWNWRVALGVSSAIYAIVHFMQKADFTGPVTWFSGLELLPGMLRGFADWQAIIPGFINLSLAGILLGLAYQRTGNLYCSIGLHIGWVFWLKSYDLITRAVADRGHAFWGTGKLIDGWLALIILVAAFAVLASLVPANPNTGTRDADC